MVCLGNICRSPLAEGLLRSKLDITKFRVDSAGTYGGHAGSSPDKRSIEVARKNGLDISLQKSRKLVEDDFNNFDYIYVMDSSNYRDVTDMAATQEQKDKVFKILDIAFPNEQLEVPDPYQHTAQAFDNVYKMLDKATAIIAKQLSDKH